MEDFEVEISGSRTELADVLSGVADGLRAGSVSLGDGEDAVAVELPPDLELEVELETEDGTHSLELELEWPATEEAPAAASGADTPTPESTDADEPDGDQRDGQEMSASPPEQERIDTPDTPDTSDSQPDPEAVSEETVAEESPVGGESPASAVVDVPDGRRSLARFEIFRDRGDEWRWRLRHRNGNIIATSGEGYTQKHNAWKGLRSVMANAPEATVID